MLITQNALGQGDSCPLKEPLMLLTNHSSCQI